MTVLSRTLGVVAAGLLGALLLAPSAHAQITIYEARQKGVDSTVTVEGTVTRAYDNFVRFQDQSGPTGASGLTVRQTDPNSPFHEDVQDGTITQGTELQVTGTLSEFNGLLQINEDDLDDYSVEGQGPLPDSQDVTLATLKADGEDYESELVRVTGLDFLTATGSFASGTSYTVTDESGSSTLQQGALTFRVQNSDESTLGGTAIPSGAFDYTGVVGEFSNQYQLIPVREADVQPARSFGFNRPSVQAEEGSGTVEVKVRAYALESGDDVSVTAKVGDESTATNGTDVTGFTSPQQLTFTGENPPPKTLSFTVADDAETEGVERLEVVLETSDGILTQSKKFTLWVLDDATAQGPIAAGDSGDVLIDSLQQRYGDPRPLGYDLARDSMYARIYNEQDTVRGTYSGFEITIDPTEDPSSDAADKGINTEHTWPQSKGAGQEPARSNLNILIPTRQQVNSDRSNLPYGESPDPDTDTWYFEDQEQPTPPPEAERPLWSELLGGQRFEPRHSVKGDVARAVFYFVTVYPNRADFSFFEAQRDTLLTWHEEDPVDATEMRRNLLQASYQDNALNPFVVDSTLVDRAYGSGADEDGDPPPTTATFDLVADENDLDPGNGNVDAQCLVQLSSGDLLFFNSEDGGIFTWDGSSLSVHRSAQELNSDISAESNTINRCDGVAVANNVVYFLFRSSATNDNYVYRTEAATPDDNAFEQFNGADGVASDGSTVYLSAISAFGAPANGIFEIDPELSGSPTELASNSDVSPGAIDVLGSTLYGYSDDFGAGNFNRTLFSLDVTASSPSFQVFANPFGVGSPLTGGDPSNDDVDGIQDVSTIPFGGDEFVVVHNQNPTAPEGEEFGTIRVSDQEIDRLFTATDLTNNLPVSDFTAAFAHALHANDQGEVFVVSGAFGPNYIAKVSEAPPLPVELASFDAVQDGASVTLRWQTASETNNARFVVERTGEQENGRAGEGWQDIGTIEGSGTTETPRAYRFTDADLPFEADALQYRLRQVDLDGSVSYSEPITVKRSVEQVTLRAPFPNPTQGQATVPFAVPERQDVTLRLYDVLGRQVRILVDGPRAGRQKAQMDLSGLSSGVYFLRLRTEGQTLTTRLTVMR